MEIVHKLIYALMLVSAIGVIILVLLQHGKGADMGTGFGSGSSGSLFGASGSANFLSRTTAIFATIFFLCTLALAYFSSHRPKAAGLMDQVIKSAPAQPVAPVQPAVPANKTNEVPK